MDMNMNTHLDIAMDYGHGSAAWIRTCRMDMDIDMQHKYGYAA
jgi:hypothetical protein